MQKVVQAKIMFAQKHSNKNDNIFFIKNFLQAKHSFQIPGWKNDERGDRLQLTFGFRKKFVSLVGNINLADDSFNYRPYLKIQRSAYNHCKIAGT